MVPVVWSERALADVRGIYEYVVHTSPVYAEALVDRILARTEQLAAHPESGRMVPEVERPEIRELLEGPYRILYRLEAGGVSVLAVIHARRVLPERG